MPYRSHLVAGPPLNISIDESETATEAAAGVNATPLTISVPLKVGPTKNIYQFTQLRDQYKKKFVQTAQLMSKLEAEAEATNQAEAQTNSNASIPN